MVGASRASAVVGAMLLAAPGRGEPATTEREFELVAEWRPIADSEYELHESHAALSVLARPVVAIERRSWPASCVGFALPRDDVAADAAYPLPAREFLPFLAQLHAGAAERVTHMVQHPGAFGFVLERSDARLDLLIRVHAGFELVPDAAWMAVAQFEGRLVVDRASGAIEHFSLALPPTRPNVDVNLRLDGRRGIADIGSIPAMRVATAAAAPPVAPERLQQARAALARAFYEFARIDWCPLPEGVVRAAAEEKPLHLVVLFGALGDESC